MISSRREPSCCVFSTAVVLTLPPAPSRAPSETLDPQGSFVTCHSDASILAIACVSTPVFKTILCTISQMFLGAHLSTGFSFKPKVTRRRCGIARAQAGVATISYLSRKTGRHAGHHSIAVMMHSPRDKCDLFERHLTFLYHWLRKYLALSTVFVCAVKVRIKDFKCDLNISKKSVSSCCRTEAEIYNIWVFCLLFVRVILPKDHLGSTWRVHHWRTKI